MEISLCSQSSLKDNLTVTYGLLLLLLVGLSQWWSQCLQGQSGEPSKRSTETQI